MLYLNLRDATTGALNILKGRYSNVRLKTQFGRHFIVSGRSTLAVGYDWQDALNNLLQTQVVAYCTRYGLNVPKDTEFTTIAKLYMDDPELLKQTYAPVNV